MSIVETKAPVAKRCIEEMVPSRYALPIGDLDVVVISDGVLPLPTTTMATNAERVDLSSWLKDMCMPPDQFDWPLNAMVVRSGDKTILVDAGLGTQFPGFPRAGRFVSRLEAAGIDLASVTDVILTHMHMDHVGGLLVEGVKERLRPDLRIHVSKAEAKFWEAPDFSQVVMPEAVPPVLRSTATAFLDMYGDKLQTFEERHEVAPGVVVRRTGGHTPGHAVVELESQGERLLFAGDAMFPVAFDHPDWQNGFEHDPVEAARVRIGLFRELSQNNGLLVASHLPFPSVGRVVAEGEVFRWVPVLWDY